MEDKQFFEQALGLKKPWKVAGVEMKMGSKRVEIEIECEGGTKWAEAGEQLHIHGYEKRKWRHLDTMQFETIIEARVPRVRYADGSTRVVEVPWAERFSRMTRMMETFIIRVLKSSSSISRACELLGMSWEVVQGVMERAVERGLIRSDSEPLHRVGIDEKSIGRGHHYATLVNDLENNRVWDLVEGRDERSTMEAIGTLSEKQLLEVKSIAIDMWPAYMKAAKEKMPEARIVHDKFHVSKHLNEAVDQVRKAEHKKLLSQGDKRLAGSKYKWMRSHDDLRSKAGREFRELYEANLKTSRAWTLKEAFRGFWKYIYRGSALKFFKAWKKSALLSRLKPVRKVVNMLAKHLEGLLNYCTEPITNAASEGFNSRVAALSANARGFRSFKNLRTRVLFFCGKLNLMPDHSS